MRFVRRGVLPGFGLAFGYTLTWLGLLVLVPLSALVLRASTTSWERFLATIGDPRTLAAFRLSFGAAAGAALFDAVVGLLLAWVLARHRFPGRRIFDAIVDLPFALPTAVAGIALTSVYAENGVLGRFLVPLGVEVAFRPLGVALAMAFVGLPFVVRAVQPVIEELDPHLEDAAAVLGASRLQTAIRVVLPALMPALLTGVALCFARALGEYGSVVFISGNLPLRTEIVPLLIVTRLEEYDYEGATALAAVMLLASFSLLLIINVLQRRSGRHVA